MLNELDNFLEKEVKIDYENFINSEGGAKPVALKRTFFMLGLDYSIVEENKGVMHRMVYLRNDIAHGSHRHPVQWDTYNEIESSAYYFMKELIKYCYYNLVNEKYKPENN